MCPWSKYSLKDVSEEFDKADSKDEDNTTTAKRKYPPPPQGLNHPLPNVAWGEIILNSIQLIWMAQHSVKVNISISCKACKGK